MLVPQDMTLWLINRLRTDLGARPESYANTCLVVGTLPSPFPARVVQVRSDGGPRLSITRDLSRFGINVLATTEQEVTNLTAIVRGLMWRLRSVPPIKDVSETGPVPVEDPSRKPWRYLSYDLLTRIKEAP
jgi:hypothetical protein